MPDAAWQHDSAASPHLAQEAELALQLRHRPRQSLRIAQALVRGCQLCPQSFRLVGACQQCLMPQSAASVLEFALHTQSGSETPIARRWSLGISLSQQKYWMLANAAPRGQSCAIGVHGIQLNMLCCVRAGATVLDKQCSQAIPSMDAVAGSGVASAAAAASSSAARLSAASSFASSSLTYMGFVNLPQALDVQSGRALFPQQG